MSYLKILGLFFAFFLATATANAQTENVVVNKLVFCDCIEFSLTNTGTESVEVSYVIIQDEVLMLSSGTLQLLPSATERIRILQPFGVVENIELELIE